MSKYLLKFLALGLQAFVALQSTSAGQAHIPLENTKLEELALAFQNDAQKVTALVQAALKPYEKVASWEYVFERNQPADPVYSRLLWREAGPKYYFEVRSLSRPAKTDIQRTGSYDGKIGYEFLVDNNVLNVSKNLPRTDILASFDSPLMPFSFLKNDVSLLRLANMALDAEKLRLLTDRIVYLGERKEDGSEYSVLRVSEAMDIAFGDKVTFEVYLDKTRGYYPMLWKKYDSDKVLIEQYAVKTLGELPIEGGARIFRYPVEASLWQARWGGVLNGPNGPVKYLGFSREIVFPHVTVDIGDSDDLYMIDPTIADVIHDLDNRSAITIPK